MASSTIRARAAAGPRRQYTTCAHAPDTKVMVAATCCCILLSFASAFSPPGSGAGAVINSRGISSSLETGPVAITTSTQLYNKLGKDFDKNDLFPRDDFDRDDFLDDDDDNDGIDYSKFDPAMAAQLRKAKQLLKESKKKVKEQAEVAAKAASAADIPGGVSQESPSKKEENNNVLPFFASKSSSTDSAKIKSKTKSGEIIADGNAMASLSKSEAWEKRPLSQMFDKEARTDFDGNLVDDEIDGSVLADRDIGIYNLRKALHNEDFRRVFDKRNRFIGEVE